MTTLTDNSPKNQNGSLKKSSNGCKDPAISRPSREEAEAAVRTLISWAGDDPTREGLVDTPKRVAKAYEEFFKGYNEDALEILSRTFEDVDGYDDMVMLRGIDMHSHCEHHMVPIIGQVHVAYVPSEKVVGISKLARIVETFAKRLQTQETMTAQIANVIEEGLNPRGIALMVEAEHQCMSMRGVHKPNVATITTRFTGVFQDDADLRGRFLGMIK
jgi:GTP cyclohydrolase I